MKMRQSRGMGRFVAGLWLAAAVPAVGGVYSPRIISEHVPDTFSVKDYREYHAWKGLKGQELALAAWKAFVSTETGVAHYQPIVEGNDPVTWELRLIRDPIKMLNTYGWGFCGAFGPTTAGLFERMGFEKARSVQIPGCNHNVTEVFYDGAWHYFDTDLRGVLFNRDGKTVASVAETIKDPTLWTRPARKDRPFFPDDPDLSVYARTYAAKPVEYCHRWFMGGSTMTFRLRKGESLTRWWRPQGGRWAHQATNPEKPFWNRPFWSRLIKRPPYGAKSNHRRFSIWTHGNGLFDYAPTLRKGCGDFEDGVLDSRNVTLTDKGLAVSGQGKGLAVFEVNSPYVIVPKVGDFTTRDDDKEGSVVTFASAGKVRVSISLDFGRSWKDVTTVKGRGDGTILDLTAHLHDRYQYLIRFELLAGDEEPLLSSLRIKTWVQVAPISLPRLKKGVNHLEYKTLDERGLATTPWMQIPNMGDAKDMARYWDAKPADFDPKRFKQRLKGTGELLFAAPPGRKIKWLSIGGFFNTYQRAAAARTVNEMWVATGDVNNWKRIYKANVPTWHEHWHYAMDKTVILDAPAEKVRVRYVGKPGVNGIRVNLHSIRPDEKISHAVVATHRYRMGGKEVTKTLNLGKPIRYTIDCPQKPENVCYRIEVPSDAQPGR